jgi:hypothetical protein
LTTWKHFYYFLFFPSVVARFPVSLQYSLSQNDLRPAIIFSFWTGSGHIEEACLQSQTWRSETWQIKQISKSDRTLVLACTRILQLSESFNDSIRPEST